jgi:hypothetical protein
MRVIKTDGRYNFHRQGFHTIVEFNTKIRHQRNHYFEFAKVVERMYGEANWYDDELKRRKYNENYRYSWNSDRKHRRIHLRDEQTVTLIALQIGAA